MTIEAHFSTLCNSGFLVYGCRHSDCLQRRHCLSSAGLFGGRLQRRSIPGFCRSAGIQTSMKPVSPLSMSLLLSQ